MQKINKLSDRGAYTMKQAIDEAKRCLRCKKPLCQFACPIDNDVPDFIYQLSMGNLGEAREILANKTNLPAVCGRVCPHEKQCEGNCVLNKTGKPIMVGLLEQFIADFDADMSLIKEPTVQKTKGNIAVIGSGPAGLTVAGDLARRGYNVIVYEREIEPGGVLLYGIPEFRLPAYVVRREIKRISSLGVVFVNNTRVGVKITVDEIFENDIDAVFIGTGTAIPNDLNLPGYDKDGVIQSNYLLRIFTLFNQDEVDQSAIPIDEGDDIIVIGAGNVAMDAARTSKRVGAKSVTVVYRKGMEDMPASNAEYQAAVDDGVEFIWEATPIEYIGDKSIKGLKVLKNDKEEIINASKILLAIGSKPANMIVSTTKGIETDENGFVITGKKPYGMTSRIGVFAGGDVVHKPATVVLAMKEAKKIAEGMDAYVQAVKLLNL